MYEHFQINVISPLLVSWKEENKQQQNLIVSLINLNY